MFNRKFVLFAGLALVLILAVGALVWFVGPRLGGEPMAFGREMHLGQWSHMPPARMPHLGLTRGGFGPMAGWGGMLGFGLFRLLGWVVQIGLIVALVTWLLRRQAPPGQPVQPIASTPPNPPPQS